jgi:hypothetical protein
MDNHGMQVQMYYVRQIESNPVHTSSTIGPVNTRDNQIMSRKEGESINSNRCTYVYKLPRYEKTAYNVHMYVPEMKVFRMSRNL